VVRGAAMISMNFNILTWNVRGLNEGRKRLKIRNLLSKWKIDIVCLQETKLKMVSNQIVHSLWRCPYKEWCHVDSIGASGGILLMWDDIILGFVREPLYNNIIL
jgi:exonuclease III